MSPTAGPWAARDRSTSSIFRAAGPPPSPRFRPPVTPYGSAPATATGFTRDPARNSPLPTNPTGCSTSSGELQKATDTPNKKLRPSFNVFVIFPNAGELKSALGAANCGVFNRFTDSARTANFPNCRDTDAFRFRIPPRRKVFDPRLPRASPGAINPNAARGSTCGAVSGFPTVRPSTAGSRRFGRSPFEPSTFPNPGPSDPVSTVNGSPVFARNVPDARQPPARFGAAHESRAISACDWSNALGPFRSAATGLSDCEYPCNASSPAAMFVYALPVSIALLNQYDTSPVSPRHDGALKVARAASKYAFDAFRASRSSKYRGSGRRSAIVAVVSGTPATGTARLANHIMNSRCARDPIYPNVADHLRPANGSHVSVYWCEYGDFKSGGTSKCRCRAPGLRSTPASGDRIDPGACTSTFKKFGGSQRACCSVCG